MDLKAVKLTKEQAHLRACRQMRRLRLGDDTCGVSRGEARHTSVRLLLGCPDRKRALIRAVTVDKTGAALIGASSGGSRHASL